MLFLLARAWFNWWITEIAVTNRRVIYKRGFISRTTAEMHMDKIESVEVDQSILGRILDYGKVTVLGTGIGTGSLGKIDEPIAAPLELRNHITGVCAFSARRREPDHRLERRNRFDLALGRRLVARDLFEHVDELTALVARSAAAGTAARTRRRLLETVGLPRDEARLRHALGAGRARSRTRCAACPRSPRSARASGRRSARAISSIRIAAASRGSSTARSGAVRARSRAASCALRFLLALGLLAPEVLDPAHLDEPVQRPERQRTDDQQDDRHVRGPRGRANLSAGW